MVGCAYGTELGTIPSKAFQSMQGWSRPYSLNLASADPLWDAFVLHDQNRQMCKPRH